jgi:ElaB/YqjD/DUF883 family membrane-anchored ribosome-binding protein
MTETAQAGAPYGSTSQQGGGGVTDKASEVKDQAKEQAQNVAGQARDRVRDQVDQRSTQAGEQVRSQAGDLRTVGEQLREQGKEGPAKVADQVAGRVEGVGSWLQDSDADKILGDVEDFARKNPWAVVAGGVALGLVASRALKASSSRRYEQRSSSGQLPVRTGTSASYRPAPPIDQPLSATGDDARFDRPVPPSSSEIRP